MKDMKVNSTLIKKLRLDKLWSQEQLAEACSLSLRTIQRLESSGNASMETVRALAAVFELNTNDLRVTEGQFERYQHTQRADYLLIAFSLMGLMLVTIQIALNATISIFMMLVFMVLILLVIMFYSLTINVSENEVAWYFGPGFWKKSLSIESIDKCRTVRNPIWYGFGIRALGAGWLYNVSGLLAVEISLSSGAKIRLGTDEPNFLKAAIDNAKESALVVKN